VKAQNRSMQNPVPHCASSSQANGPLTSKQPAHSAAAISAPFRTAGFLLETAATNNEARRLLNKGTRQAVDGVSNYLMKGPP
jgi:hypothetical protein